MVRSPSNSSEKIIKIQPLFKFQAEKSLKQRFVVSEKKGNATVFSVIF